MYIMIQEKKYTLTSRKVFSTSIKYYSLNPIPSDPNNITGIISMYRDDGFLLSEDNANDYLRKYISGSVLTLTNEPEPPDPGPEPDPEPTPPTEWDVLQQKVTQMELDSIEQGQFATDLQLDILTMQIDQKGE